MSRGSNFRPRITEHAITENTTVINIEPPCGSNTMVIKSMGEVLFVDSGYAIYEKEMLGGLREILPEFDGMRKRIFVTHADVDHCGLLHLFDEVFASRRSAECLRLEYDGENGYREQNPLHSEYIWNDARTG